MSAMNGKDQEDDKDNFDNGPSHLDSIPFDLTVEILTRLPVKSLLKFQYVSKTWCSIIRSKNFINSLVSISSTPSPRLLISFKNGQLTNKNPEKRLFFFTSLQDQEDKSSSLVANLDMTMASKDSYFYTRGASVNGFISLSYQGRSMVCNPSTRQVLTLPKIETAGTKWVSVFKFLGYDPVNDQYKAMCKRVSYSEEDQDHMVLTLGGDKPPKWRQIKGTIHNYYPLTEGICINGFVYYGASTPHMSRVIVCLDVRSEKLSFIGLPSMDSIHWGSTSTLINYKGKLANVNLGHSHTGTHYVFDLWVLLDAKEHQWSIKRSVVLRFWWDPLNKLPITFHGTNNNGEIIISPKFLLCGLRPFPIIFFDVENKYRRKVQLEGIADDEEFRRRYGIGNNGNCNVYISSELCGNYNFL